MPLEEGHAVLRCIEEPQVSFRQGRYRKMRDIGHGAYSHVMLVYDKVSGDNRVIKRVYDTDAVACNEVEILKKIKEHPNIVKFFDSFHEREGETNVLHIVMEYCEGGDLAQFLRDRQPPNWIENSLLEQWMAQLLQGVGHLHELNILHRDLKTANVFVAANNTLKIADFGISRSLTLTHQCATTMVGTPYYMAPEVVNLDVRDGYNEKSDVWSLGVILYELCALRLPFPGANVIAVATGIMENKPKQLPDHVPTKFRDIIAALMHTEAARRPTLHEVLQTWLPSNPSKDVAIPLNGIPERRARCGASISPRGEVERKKAIVSPRIQPKSDRVSGGGGVVKGGGWRPQPKQAARKTRPTRTASEPVTPVTANINQRFSPAVPEPKWKRNPAQCSPPCQPQATPRKFHDPVEVAQKRKPPPRDDPRKAANPSSSASSASSNNSSNPPLSPPTSPPEGQAARRSRSADDGRPAPGIVKQQVARFEEASKADDEPRSRFRSASERVPGENHLAKLRWKHDGGAMNPPEEEPRSISPVRERRLSLLMQQERADEIRRLGPLASHSSGDDSPLLVTVPMEASPKRSSPVSTPTHWSPQKSPASPPVSSSVGSDAPPPYDALDISAKGSSGSTEANSPLHTASGKSSNCSTVREADICLLMRQGDALCPEMTRDLAIKALEEAQGDVPLAMHNLSQGHIRQRYRMVLKKEQKHAEISPLAWPGSRAPSSAEDDDSPLQVHGTGLSPRPASRALQRSKTVEAKTGQGVAVIKVAPARNRGLRPAVQPVQSAEAKVKVVRRKEEAPQPAPAPTPAPAPKRESIPHQRPSPNPAPAGPSRRPVGARERALSDAAARKKKEADEPRTKLPSPMYTPAPAPGVVPPREDRDSGGRKAPRFPRSRPPEDSEMKRKLAEHKKGISNARPKVDRKVVAEAWLQRQVAQQQGQDCGPDRFADGVVLLPGHLRPKTDSGTDSDDAAFPQPQHPPPAPLERRSWPDPQQDDPRPNMCQPPSPISRKSDCHSPNHAPDRVVVPFEDDIELASSLGTTTFSGSGSPMRGSQTLNIHRHAPDTEDYRKLKAENEQLRRLLGLSQRDLRKIGFDE